MYWRGLDLLAFPPQGRLEKLLYLLDHLEAVLYYKYQKLYSRQDTISSPSEMSFTSRNAYIVAQFEQGVSLTTLANQFKLSPQRVFQIVRGE